MSSAAGPFMLWQASTKQVQETEDLNQNTDPSWVSLEAVKAHLKPSVRNTNIGSGYDSSSPGPAGNGWYSPFLESTTSSPTLALPFQEMGLDIPDIPPLLPAAYPVHFQIPPLRPGGFAAPDENEINPLVVVTFQHIPDIEHITAQHEQGAGYPVHAPSRLPCSGNNEDPAYGMELSDSEYFASPSATLALQVVPNEHPSHLMEVSDNRTAEDLGTTRTVLAPETRSNGAPLLPTISPGNDMDPVFSMELSDNEWDPCVGLVLSNDEDVAAHMEISDDDT
ncbi:hypothetical protein DXG01_006819 [Tephrocybe rancida]|nr:hypothetical protein DXG01_006819 [Tephrocybe rancida]